MSKLIDVFQDTTIRFLILVIRLNYLKVLNTEGRVCRVLQMAIPDVILRRDARSCLIRFHSFYIYIISPSDNQTIIEYSKHGNSFLYFYL